MTQSVCCVSLFLKYTIAPVDCGFLCLVFILMCSVPSPESWFLYFNCLITAHLHDVYLSVFCVSSSKRRGLSRLRLLGFIQVFCVFSVLVGGGGGGGG